jgi:HK97 family phage major capsid protein
MALATTTSTVGGILPQDWGPLIVEPVTAAAICLRPSVSTVIGTDSVKFHLPVVNADAGAAWLTEGQTITPTDPTISELVITPAKVGGLTVVSSELANDSSPAAAQLVGMGLARSIAQKLDAAFFGNLTAPAPAGLGSLANSAVSRVIAGVAPTTLDAFAQAISLVAQDGAEITSWCANPVDALLIQTLKLGTGYAGYLLGGGAENGTAAQILGLPLLVSAQIPQGVIWGLAAARNTVIMRNLVEVAVSADAYFNSDQIAVRATMRVGIGFPTPKAVAKIALAAS